MVSVLVLGPNATPARADLADRPLPTTDSPVVRSLASQYSLTSDDALKRAKLQYDAGDIVSALKRELGESYAGVWFDVERSRFVVGQVAGADAELAMRRADAAESVLRATAFAPVRFTWAQLEDEKAGWDRSLDASLTPGQWSTGIDSVRNAVRVTLSASVDAQRRHGLQRLADESRGEVVIVSDSRKSLALSALACSFPNCQRPLRGGVEINSSYGRCTAGFLVFSNSGLVPYLLTAGHCLIDNAPNTSWYATHPGSGSKRIGTNCCGYVDTAHGDEALISIADSSFWAFPLSAEAVAWSFTEHYPIYGTSEGYVGLFHCHEGRTTAGQCGTDSSHDVTWPVDYTEEGLGVVNVGHLNANTACGQEGDSGGPWLNQYTASGIHVGGGCGFSVYQPASWAAAVLGVHIASAS